MERESLGSRMGFILLSAGCAIGIGNVWKFPYMAGSSGGGAFVLFYLFFLVVMGVPIMTMEFATGRASRKSPAKLFTQLEKAGTKMASAWSDLYGRQLHPDDVLYDSRRLDAVLSVCGCIRQI